MERCVTQCCIKHNVIWIPELNKTLTQYVWRHLQPTVYHKNISLFEQYQLVFFPKLSVKSVHNMKSTNTENSVNQPIEHKYNQGFANSPVNLTQIKGLWWLTNISSLVNFYVIMNVAFCMYLITICTALQIMLIYPEY
jgi:hypothetical protein